MDSKQRGDFRSWKAGHILGTFYPTFYPTFPVPALLGQTFHPTRSGHRHLSLTYISPSYQFSREGLKFYNQ